MTSKEFINAMNDARSGYPSFNPSVADWKSICENYYSRLSEFNLDIFKKGIEQAMIESGSWFPARPLITRHCLDVRRWEANRNSRDTNTAKCLSLGDEDNVTPPDVAKKRIGQIVSALGGSMNF